MTNTNPQDPQHYYELLLDRERRDKNGEPHSEEFTVLNNLSDAWLAFCEFYGLEGAPLPLEVELFHDAMERRGDEFFAEMPEKVRRLLTKKLKL